MAEQANSASSPCGERNCLSAILWPLVPAANSPNRSWRQALPKYLPPRSQEAAFTLIEITIAIVILATSLVVLLGLQASSVQRAVQDRNAQQAMLIAREMLSALEISSDPAGIGDRAGSPEEVLRDLLGAAALPEDDLDPEQRFEVELNFIDVELPNFGPGLLTRAVLTVRWVGGPPQGLVVDYFIPEDPQ